MQRDFANFKAAQREVAVEEAFLPAVTPNQVAYRRPNQYRRWAEQHVELLNYATRDIPRQKIRFHTCYSVAFGPRVYDMELKDVIDLLAKINAGAHSFEAANPRHEHEWKDWQTVKLPEGTVLIPGVITQSSV